MKDQIIEKLRGQKILILGFGREGKSTLAFLERELPDAEIAIADINPIEDESCKIHNIYWPRISKLL